LADVFVRAKNPQAARNFYGSAIEALAKDDSLEDSEKKTLGQKWTEAAKRLENVEK
jgi:hypothetical protein